MKQNQLETEPEVGIVQVGLETVIKLGKKRNEWEGNGKTLTVNNSSQSTVDGDCFPRPRQNCGNETL